MAPLNYSKWDNIDVDSDEDVAQPIPEPTPSTSTSSGASAPSPTSPAAAMSEANPSQQPGKVAAVFAPCIGERKGDLFLPTVIDDDHPVFTQGELSPVGRLVGFEILVWRMETRDYREIGHSPGHDNQAITYMMIERENGGFAAPHWQSGVGSVIIARADKKPLARNHVEAFWMHCDDILEAFGDGPLSAADKAQFFTPAGWERFFTRYAIDQNEYGSKSFKGTIKPWDV